MLYVTVMNTNWILYLVYFRATFQYVEWKWLQANQMYYFEIKNYVWTRNVQNIVCRHKCTMGTSILCYMSLLLRKVKQFWSSVLCILERPASISNEDGRQLCAVCNDIANGIHFGAVTCEGCKVINLRHYLSLRPRLCLSNLFRSIFVFPYSQLI